ncbi:MAG: hypothetical protein KF703_19315, partial [Actinobacteria bacterium]|nr:hypothetical protein [Actinomycetota bacterium]
MPSRRLLLVLAAAVVGVLVLAGADPAAADPARPTDYRSRVLAVEPGLPAGVTLRVVGGDGFLLLEVAPGHTATVPDYEQDRDQAVGTYLRFRADGVVERNDASLAAQVNDARYGSDPGSAWRPGAAPRWRQVASGGRYAWHDHRIHWMLDRPPTAVDERGRVDLGGPG